LGQIFAAASGAASGARPSGFTFDPSSTLPWAVPFVLLAPFASFLLAVSSIRTRRSAAAMAMFGTTVMLLLTLLVGWGLVKRGSPFQATYQYISLSVAFSGPSNFQSFAINITMHADHLTVAALVVLEICVMSVIGWHRIMGRAEPGPARFYAEVTALLFACAGILLSTDLAELFAFWTIAGTITFLLLAHRWGMDEAASRARVALALPFITDLFLLCGIAWLYSRYGTQDLTTLIPILHTNPGWTVRSLVVGAVLLFVGVSGRLALWPLVSWITQTSTTAPPAASAIAQSVWAVVGITVLYRLMPIVAASNQQTMQALIVACGVSAIAAPILSIFINEPRRSVTLASSAAIAIGTAVVIRGFEYSNLNVAAAGVACVLAAAPARGGATLAVSSIAAAMRTDDLAEMGDAWRRMRASAVALAMCAAVVGLSACGALAFGVSSRSKTGVALGEAVVLISAAMLRIFLAASFGPLRRRRAFDPDRVREAPQPSLSWPYWLALAGAALLIASLLPAWLNLLDGLKHPAPPVLAYVVWAGAAAIGFVAAGAALARGKDSVLAVSARAGVWLNRGTAASAGLIDRFLIEPVIDIAYRLDRWIPAGDGALARFAIASGQFAAASVRAPALPLMIALVAALAVLVALLAPGIAR
jgi:NADH:ubiquinone oxidoreductase subunit 5 (subunit L)/multisubunit Na+/H+ antiporter MnhA subunit